MVAHTSRAAGQLGGRIFFIVASNTLNLIIAIFPYIQKKYLLICTKRQDLQVIPELWFQSTEIACCHVCGVCNLKVVARFLENICTSLKTTLKYLIYMLVLPIGREKSKIRLLCVFQCKRCHIELYHNF